MNIFRLFCACFVAMAWTSVALAAPDVWDANGASPPNGIWGTANNWVDNTTPGNSDTATFDLHDSYTVTFNANPLAIQALTVSTGTTATFASSGGARTLLVNSATGGQDVSITGATTSLTLGTSGNQLNLTAGDDLSVQSGATLNVRFNSDVQAVDFSSTGLNGTINVDGAGSSLTITGAGQMAIARISASNLVVQNGANGTITGGLAVSPTAALAGAVSVLSGGNLALSGDLTIATGGIVGQSGSVAINGTNSQIVLSGASATTVGSASNGTAAVNIGTTTTGGTLTTGTGAMTINATGTVTIGSGANTGILNANGNVTINGGTLTTALGSAFNLATGRTMTISGGGTASFANTYQTASNAIYNITGSGSDLTTGGSLSIVSGATVNVSSGGLLSSTGSTIGIAGPGNGSLFVGGSGSSAVAGGATASSWGLSGTANVVFEDNASGSFLGGIELANSAAGGTGAIVLVQTGADLTTGFIGLARAGGFSTSATLSVQGSGSTVTQSGAVGLTVGHATTGTAAINIGTTGSGAVFTTGTGTLTINSTGDINIGSGANTGTLNANGDVAINVGGQLTRGNGSAFNLAAGRTMTLTNGGTANFIGTDFTGSGGYTTAANAIYNVNGGQLLTGGSFNITSGAQVNVTGLGVVNSTSSFNILSAGGGTLTVDGSGASVSGGGNSLWGRVGGTANVSFSNGAIGSFGAIELAGSSTAGTTAVVNVLSGADLNLSNSLLLTLNAGATTSATLNVQGSGSNVTQSGASDIFVGHASLGTAVINIGTTTSGGTLTTGTGTLTINATGAVNIGSGANTGTLNANGDVTIDGGTLTQASGNFVLAAGRQMTIQNGGAANFFIYGTAANAVYNVIGAGSELTTALQMIINDGAQVVVSSGGRLSSGSFLRLGTSGNGSLTVDGAGSSASFSGNILLGGGGNTGILALSNNAVLSTSINPIIMADGAGSTAVATVESGADISTGFLVLAANGGSAASATLTVRNLGSSVTPMNLTIGHSATGTAVINVLDAAALIVGTGGTTNLNATGTINIDGGTVDLKTLNDTGGTINFTAGSLSYLGNLTVGTGGLLGTNLTLDSFRALTLSGTTTIDAGRTLTLDGGTLSTGSLVVNGAFHFDRGTLAITGGTISGLGNLTVGSGAELRAHGVQTLAIVGVAGSAITATGNLTLGNSSAVNGFGSAGTVNIGAHTVTLSDANDVVFDSLALVTLGVGGSPGTLAAANGLTLDFGGNLTGFGTVSTPNNVAKPLTNNGHITGNSGAQPITLTGYVKGVGTLDNVVITGTDAPGFSPATVVRGSVIYDGTLEIEIGGTTVGSFDRIHHLLGAGLAGLGGTLDVALINGFNPALDDAFEIITAAGGVSGKFDTLADELPTLSSGLEWAISYGANNVVLAVVSAGLPGDFNFDGTVDAADYVVWRKGVGIDPTPANYNIWRAHFGETLGNGSGASVNNTVPEPTTLVMLIVAAVGICLRRRHIA